MAAAPATRPAYTSASRRTSCQKPSIAVPPAASSVRPLANRSIAGGGAMGQRLRPAVGEGTCRGRVQWAHLDSNQEPRDYAYHYGFRRQGRLFVVWTVPSP